MSKYIRTKDRIYERMFPDCEKQRISFDHKTIEPAYFTADYEWVAQKDVIKHDDDIKELCDEFVIHFAYGYHLITINDGKVTFKDGFLDFSIELKVALESDWEIYGEIWVDGELHKAAQMDKEGDLKLL